MDTAARKYNSDLLRGSTDGLLLHVVNELGETYAYRIIKELDARSAGYFRFSAGTTYPALHRLEDQGLIQGEWRKKARGAARRYYSITGLGQELLCRKRVMWSDFARAMALVIEGPGASPRIQTSDGLSGIPWPEAPESCRADSEPWAGPRNGRRRSSDFQDKNRAG